ncbi:MAG: hypothetical protein IPJ13_08380, partial [Saprospiraceae bacterium]|nr:hypothetical protein [Saprospiraceae bacterium]
IIILDEPYNGVDLESNESDQTHHQNTIATTKDADLVFNILSTITDICDDVNYFTENRHSFGFPSTQLTSLQRSIEQ